ncbi:MFS transporter [Xylophilus sp. GW821-FHT01B05]
MRQSLSLDRHVQRGAVPVLLAVALMYVSLGVVLGFVQGGVATILRARGVELAAMRWVFALYIPFGVAFLWAPWVDRWRMPWLGRRTGWITAAQGLAVVLVAALAAGEAWPPALQIALGLATTVSMATMDLALDALTVEQVHAEQRPLAAAAKVGGLSLGAVLGGGVLVGLFPTLGWQWTFVSIAALIALAAVPVLALVRRDAAHQAQAPVRPRLLATLRQPAMQRRLLKISLVTCALMALFNFNRLMLVDLQVPLERIGWVLGTMAPLANLAASAIAPWLMQGLARPKVLWALVLLCLASTALTAWAYAQYMPGVAMAGAVLIGACVSAIYIVLGASILAWARGHQAATDYALLYGVGRFIGTLALFGLPGLIPLVGWAAFYGVCGVALVGTVWVFIGEAARGSSGSAAPTKEE